MDSPFKGWSELNDRIIGERLTFLDVKNRLLATIWDLDQLRRKGGVDEGTYRQKGNYFKNTVIALVQAECSRKQVTIDIKEREIEGRTDVHRVDFAYIRDDVCIVAGEAKAMGSPPCIEGGKPYPERKVGIDIDKRIKEVKYTPTDLKRRANPEVDKGWSLWVAETYPRFYVHWLMRLGSKDNMSNLIGKIAGVNEYVNGVSAVIFKEENETYDYVFLGGEHGIRKVDDLISEIVAVGTDQSTNEASR